MRIGICDDSEQDRQKIYNWIRRNYSDITESCIFQFSCGEAVIEFLRGNQLDVLFLDCKMDGLNGITTAKRTWQKDKKIKIVAITDFKQYALFGYDAGIYRYILKKDFEDKIPEVFNKIMQENKLFDQKIYCAKTDQGVVRLLVADIVHIESVRRKKNIFLTDQSMYTVYSQMSDLAALFEPFGFVRPHHSYLINSVYVLKFTNEEITLTSNITIPISRKYAKTAYERLINLLS